MTAPEKLAKLPVWAQDHINDLQRQRDTAVRKLQAYVNTQTPSHVYIEDMECLSKGSPDFVRQYIQTTHVTFEYGGVKLEVSLRGESDGLPEMRLQWSALRRHMGDVIMQPKSFQNVVLKMPKGTEP